MEWLRGLGKKTITVDGCEVVEGDLIADGGFAYVYRGTDTRSGEPRAIRKVLLQENEAILAAKTEIDLLRGIPLHENLVRFYGAGIVTGSPAQAVFIFELCPGGTLFDHLEKAIKAAHVAPVPTTQSFQTCCCPCLSSQEVLSVFRCSVAALEHLHARSIVHYDVKNDNLLMGADNLWKLSDFGSASTKTFELNGAAKKLLFEVEDFIHGRCTPMYRSPELADVHLRWPIGPKVDIFSLGCVLFATLTGVHPFPVDSLLGNIQAKYALPAEAEKHYAQQVLRWVHQSLQRDPKNRPSAAQLRKEVDQFLTSDTKKDHGCTLVSATKEDALAFTHVPSGWGDFPAASPNPVDSLPAWTADFSAGSPNAVDGLPAWTADFSSGAEGLFPKMDSSGGNLTDRLENRTPEQFKEPNKVENTEPSSCKAQVASAQPANMSTTDVSPTTQTTSVSMHVDEDVNEVPINTSSTQPAPHTAYQKPEEKLVYGLENRAPEQCMEQGNAENSHHSSCIAQGASAQPANMSTTDVSSAMQTTSVSMHVSEDVNPAPVNTSSTQPAPYTVYQKPQEKLVYDLENRVPEQCMDQHSAKESSHPSCNAQGGTAQSANTLATPLNLNAQTDCSVSMQSSREADQVVADGLICQKPENAALAPQSEDQEAALQTKSQTTVEPASKSASTDPASNLSSTETSVRASDGRPARVQAKRGMRFPCMCGRVQTLD